MELVIAALALAGLALALSRRSRRLASSEDGGGVAEAEQEGAAQGEPEEDDESWWSGEPVEIPIDGTLDLHNFSPKEVGELVPDYLEACRERDILDVRIVHGKGKGVLRRTVWASLERHPAVEHFELAGHGGGSWGATEVRLRPKQR